jgi:hypothetical protein
MSKDILLYYCITEDMLADIFTKIVAGAQDQRLMVRFFNDCDELLLELPASAKWIFEVLEIHDAAIWSIFRWGVMEIFIIRL